MFCRKTKRLSAGKVTQKREKYSRKVFFSFHFRVLSKPDAVKVAQKREKCEGMFYNLRFWDYSIYLVLLVC